MARGAESFADLNEAVPTGSGPRKQVGAQKACLLPAAGLRWPVPTESGRKKRVASGETRYRNKQVPPSGRDDGRAERGWGLGIGRSERASGPWT
jgi:hypothetical protein